MVRMPPRLGLSWAWATRIPVPRVAAPAALSLRRLRRSSIADLRLTFWVDGKGDRRLGEIGRTCQGDVAPLTCLTALAHPFAFGWHTSPWRLVASGDPWRWRVPPAR